MFPRDKPEQHTALIVGCAGQGGYYLSKELRQQGLRVVGLSRTGLFGGTSIIAPSVSLNDVAGIINLLAAIQPDFIYYLAAYHHSSHEPEANSDVAMRRGFKIHVGGFEIMLSAATKLARRSRVF